ncbi:MAG: hypothetical protein IKR19_08290 [Acholeplasmatales bacterium]|nr:hypothetical protein [Acholeplasmatales bacterium]
MDKEFNTNLILNRYNSFNSNTESAEEEDIKLGVSIGNKTNVVSGSKLRSIQSRTLNDTKYYISKTFGPMGSNTKIITGQNYNDISSSYSKDGLKVLSKIINSGPIEASIIEELIEITKHVEHEVGDGTTSTVILSALIFDRLRNLEAECPPYEIIERFKEVVEKIKEGILSDAKEITLDDIYNIAMISTNGNKKVSEDIRQIYEDFGFDVELNVGISNNEQTMRKVYDGLTITEGYSDACFINNRSNNTSEIHHAKVFHFADPIDDMFTISLFESIINHNIYEPIKEEKEIIPTVITCPQISSDMSSILKQLAQQLYMFDQKGSTIDKPPILVVTKVVGSDELIMDDIATLCGCKTIHKYIDPKVYEKDKNDGLAPTVDTVWEFAGEAELVVADARKTKFINPSHMKTPEGENDPIYTSMINFLQTEIDSAADKNAVEVGMLKKRLAALQSNMVDYLVGGITVSDRDAIKDLAEDAIKNCRSAALYGTGYAANYEGLKWSYSVINEFKDSTNNFIANAIFAAYFDIAKILYGTVCKDESNVELFVAKSLNVGHPFNIKNGILNDDLSNEKDNMSVRCSIMLDINILDTIAKIITRMVTCNQCLLQASHLNTYE